MHIRIELAIKISRESVETRAAIHRKTVDAIPERAHLHQPHARKNIFAFTRDVCVAAKTKKVESGAVWLDHL
jgi:hypothetical protein